MNDQRKVIYTQRDEIISSTTMRETFFSMSEELLGNIVRKFIPEGVYREEWDIEGLVNEINRVFDLEIDHKIITASDITEEDIVKTILDLVTKTYEGKEDQYGKKLMDEASKYILLASLDHVWKEHLHYLDHLRHGISLRAYGQKDPLNEYKREAFSLFEKMLDYLQELFVGRMARIHLDANTAAGGVFITNRKTQQMHETREDPAFSRFNAGSTISAQLQPVKAYVAPEERKKDDPTTWGKISRNEVCPCGSGKKFKHCHGS